MASQPAEFAISTWAPSSSPLRIEYSKEVLEEIRVRAVEGFYKLSRGGVEVAGLLLGEVLPHSIRVLAHCPFEIEYAYGPVFSLSPRDLSFIRKLIDDLRQPRETETTGGEPVPVPGMRVLGFYVSHSRNALSMKESERALFEELFPHDWQTVLLVKPSRDTETTAAFFVRETDGKLRTAKSHGEFALAPLLGERRARPARNGDPSLRALADAARRPGADGEPKSTETTTSLQQNVAGAATEEELRAIHDAKLRAMRLAERENRAAGAPDTEARTTETGERTNASSRVPPPPVPSGESAVAKKDSIPAKHEETESATPSTALKGPPSLLPASTSADAAPAAKAPEKTPIPAVAAVTEEVDEESRQAELPGWTEERVETSPVRATHWLRWAIPAVALVLLLVLGFLLYQAFNSTPPTVVFYARDTGENVEVVWQLKGLTDARSALITITTDGETRQIDLIRSGQLAGTYTDPFIKPTSVVRLDVDRSSSPAIRRTAQILSADSPVANLDDAAIPQAAGSVSLERTDSATEAATAAPDLSLEIGAREVIPARAVETEAEAPSVPLRPAPSTEDTPTSAAANDQREPTVREEAQQRIPPDPQPAEEERRTPVRMTEIPSPAASTSVPSAPVPATVAQASPPPVTLQRTPPANITPPAPVTGAPPVRTAPPAQPAERNPIPERRASTPATNPAVRPAAPAAAVPERIRAGRMIWTGTLKKNQTLEIAGRGATHGVVNSGLPGQPVRINVLPGALTPQGLIVYTANPKYRNSANATEAPSSTNGWNQTRYRYDPAKANSVIVTAIPNQTNGWQGITVRNDDKNINVIVVDWQEVTP